MAGQCVYAATDIVCASGCSESTQSCDGCINECADEQTTAIMCSEEDPAQCHRHHLIARYLRRERPEIIVRHIRGDGTVFSAASLRGSVDDKPQPEQPSLF